jgi:hypothetical protein
MDLIKTTGKKVDPITADLITEGFEQLKQSHGEIYTKLLEITAMQTGFNFSPINFLKYFDSMGLSNIFVPILNEVKGSFNTVVNVESFLNNFYSANRKNSKFVPFISTGRDNPTVSLQENDDILRLSSKNNNAGRKFVRTGITTTVANYGVKESQRVDILWKRIGVDNNNGDVYYIKMNVKSTPFTNEYHNDADSFNADIKFKENSITAERTKELLAKKDKLNKYNETVPAVPSNQEIYNQMNTKSDKEYTDYEMVNSWEYIKDKWLSKYSKEDWDNMTEEEREIVIKNCL